MSEKIKCEWMEERRKEKNIDLYNLGQNTPSIQPDDII